MFAHEDNIYIDPDIPIQQQIAFLRRSSIGFQVDAYEVLKDKFGKEGIIAFKDIMRQGWQRAASMMQGQSFETIGKMSSLTDKIMGAYHIRLCRTG